ncbi:MAG: alpha/beta fold hydrolase [Selenomonadaceae bacterium]|nr:alpha/beta fold hydrolase [Selenomonadaceae bacterium]
MIIPGAEPFFLQGGSHGVLLIHGFTGNPAELLLMGRHLQSQGFTVLGVRLAGHGTNEKDMAHMTKDDWIASTLDGYSILRDCCEMISVVGHSMGALLSLHLAAMLKIDVHRLVTLAPPIFIDESLNLHLLPPREQSQGRFVRKARRNLKNVPSAVNRTYRSMPLISIHELLDLIEIVKTELSKIKIPILILQGKEDRTVKIKSADYIYKNVASIEKQVKLMSNMGHLLPLREGRDEIFEITLEFLRQDIS